MKKSWITYLLFIGLVVLIAVAGGLWGRKKGGQSGERCEADKNPIRPLYEVKAFLPDQFFKKFCSIPCAQIWQRGNKDKVVYFTVLDEKTGQSFDSSLAFFVESDVTAVPEVKSRIHTFSSKTDALAHAQQFKGKLIDNPLGTQFIPTFNTPFEKVKMGGVPCLDLLPFHLATFKPIFRENRLDVEITIFQNENERDEALVEGKVDAIVVDLPAGVLLNRGVKRFPVVRTVMRTNPRRPMYAFATVSKEMTNRSLIKENPVAISKDLSSRFVAEILLQGEGIRSGEIRWLIQEDMESVLKALFERKAKAAFLREPFVTWAITHGSKNLLDDSMRSLGISVILFSKEFVDKKPETVKKFLFGYEQAVLALNFQPDRYRTLLMEKGGLPGEIKDKYPMPILEGANAPSESEVVPVVEWLIKEKFIQKSISYEELVTLNFLPNPENVGLAFCCR